jgi:predicted O-methyltransferase YrrM
MKNVFDFIRNARWDIRFIISRQVPLRYLLYFLKINPIKKIYNRNTRRKYSNEFSNWLRTKQNLLLSNDWFSSHVPFWLSAIEDYDLRDKHLKVLEIGSWEGLSSYFILSEISNAHLTCVDTWEGSVEHKSYNFPSEFNLLNIEKTFDKNMSLFESRFTKFKGTSLSFFLNNSTSQKFDFIYVDGSHEFNDVLTDIFFSFQMLEIGGIMVMDDYLWNVHENSRLNSMIAINFFLRVQKGSYKIIFVTTQVAIVKTR